jgi:dUTP pyrophosphatase
MDIKCKIVRKGSAVPMQSAYHGDAGIDLVSAVEGFSIMPGEIVSVPCGIALEIPIGFVGIVAARSGQAKRGLTLASGIGVLDSGYRGEVMVLLQNISAQPHYVVAGDRIAQVIVMPVAIAKLVEVLELSPSERGENGWGSSGVKYQVAE